MGASEITRRGLLQGLVSLPMLGDLAIPRIGGTVDLRIALDPGCKPLDAQVRGFFANVLPEAARDLAKAGVTVHVCGAEFRVERLPNRPPRIEGLVDGAVNMVLTRTIPMEWDRGRALKGLSFRVRKAEVCMIALEYAHPHRVPLLATNTVLHELLHVLRGDTRRRNGPRDGLTEASVDWWATRLWLARERSSRA